MQVKLNQIFCFPLPHGNKILNKDKNIKNIC